MKVPIKPDSMPEKPDPSDKKLLPDPNTWIYVAYSELRTKICECIDPLQAYLATFKKHQKEYTLDPVAYVKAMDDEENPPEAEALRKDVIFHRKEAERLTNEIPESIVVSMFTVNCDTIRKQLVQKHIYIAEEEINLIAKQAKVIANKTMEAFVGINDKINSSPGDIEELASIREFIAGVPNEVEKLEGEIKNGMQVFGILESFGYKFADDEDYDKQWKLYGSPCDTHVVIKQQKEKLEKEEQKMVYKMQADQHEFDNKQTEIQRKVGGFTQFQDINAFEDVAKMAKEMWEGI